MADLKDVLNKERDEEIEYLKELSLTLMPALEQVYETIPIKEFETYLLPYILGLVERNEANQVIYRDNYFKYSKHYRHALYVIDNTGEIIYKLPPLVMDANLKKLQNINLNMMVNAIENKDSSNSYFNTILRATTDALNESIEPDERILRGYLYELNKIYKDYSYLTENKIKEQYSNTPNKSIVENDDLDDFLD